ncbi:MAG: aminotransferase class III-fold pyridoxal phosphate-dependent enzyme [Oscillospiraceae bacterium]|nr:aminotransferase class III-fold pyridoxal phosphate-dependent enzyme [Oscillospiraceae bacterium]
MDTRKSTAIVERDKAVIAPCSRLAYFPLVIEKASGAVITDVDGNEYIDFLSSASSLNMGSNNPVVTDAIKAQLDRFSQFAIAYTYNERTVEYAERLTSVFPGGVKAKIAFGNCGSDGNDAAVKFARAYTGRQKIIVFINGYHGNTYGSSTMTTCSTKMHEKMGPFLPEIYAFPFFGNDVPDDVCERDCVSAIETAFSTWLPANEVAAVVIEPIQGDAGILPAHPIFMKKLYELCRKHGILFISEEVQQAFYRTGKFFSIEHYDIVPDGIIMGKSIGGSLTLGAFMARDEIMDCLPAPAHLFTLGGNAAACAGGIAAFDLYRSPDFQQHLQDNINTLWAEAEALKEKNPDLVQFVRGIGMSMGIGVCRTLEDGTKIPDPDATFKVLFRCYEKGLLVISLGANVLRIQPPLVITGEQLKKAFAIIDEAMADFRAGKIDDSVLSFRAGW